MADLKYSDLKVQKSGGEVLYITVTDKVNGVSTGKPQNFYDICKAFTGYKETIESEKKKLRSFAKTVSIINGLNVPKDSSGNNLYSKVDTEIGMRIYTASDSDLSSLSSSNAVTITKFGKTDEDGRELFATWSWGKGSETEKYEYVWSYGVGLGVWFIGSEGSTENKQCTYSPPEEANKVKFVVKPICKDSSKSGSSTTKKKWIGVWSVEQIYDYRNDPPNTPDKESISASIDDKLTFKISISIDDIGQTGINTRYGDSLGHIQFRILQYDSNDIIPTASIYKTVTYPIVKNADNTYSSSGYLEKVPAGYNYTIICRSVKGVNANDYRYSEWSEPTEYISARPGRITDSEFVSVTAISPTSVRLVWKKKRSASKYQIRYTTNRFAFDGYPDISSTEATGSPFGSEDLLFTIITGIDPGFEWFFEIRPYGTGESETPWSNYKSVYLGIRPDPPTTWSSSSSAVIDDPDDPLTLYWIHNSKDGSLESSADVELMYNDDESTSDLITIEKSSDPLEQNMTSSFVIDSSRFDELGISPVENIKWRVRTEGISKRSDTEYVTEENDEQYITDFLSVANTYYDTFVNGDEHGVEYGYPSYEAYKYYTMFNKNYYSKCLKDPKDPSVDTNLSAGDRQNYFGLINVMDCSVFGALCLMGIPAEKTPYAYFVEVSDSDIFNECKKSSGNKWAFVNVDKIDGKYYISKTAIGEYTKIAPLNHGITSVNMFDNPVMNGNKYVRTQLYERDSTFYADDIDMTTHAVYKRIDGSDTIYYSLINLLDNDNHDGVLEVIGYERKNKTITGSIVRRVDKSKIFKAAELYYPSDLDSDRFEKIREVYVKEKESKPWAVDILDMNNNTKPSAAYLCEMLENAGRLVQFSINKSNLSSSNLTNVRKGDILFFAANPSVEDRYKAVSHISIVTEIEDSSDPYNTLKFIEVTNFGTVVRKDYLKNRRYHEDYYDKSSPLIPAANFLVSICRPILNRDARYLYENGSYKSDWSVQRSIDLYSKPTVNVSITSEDDPMVVTKYPIILRAEAYPSEQDIIGLSIDIMSKDAYDYEDEFGIIRYVKESDIVYSKYFNRSDTFYNEYSQQDVPYIMDNVFYYLLQPNEIDLQTNKDYVLKCEVVMNSGLKASSEIEFKALFEETEVYPDASVEIDDKNLVVYIAPWCWVPAGRPKSVTYDSETDSYTEGSYLDYTPTGVVYITREHLDPEGSGGVQFGQTHFTGLETDPEESRKLVFISESDDFYCYERYMKDQTEDYILSVYRRELDGTFTLIADNISSGSGYYVIDPHPSLQNASYRIIATSKTTDSTAAVNTGYLDLGERSLVIQWDEKITDGTIFADRFEDTESTPWGGKILKLPYNIDISESTSRDIDKIEYSGRKHPVTYYGTQTGESMSVNLDIDKSDTNTINLLRELSIYQGDVYVREPSGVGYWASIDVSFSRNHLNLVVPVSFDITRVEGGM